jgi:hypothetical protein
MYRSVTLVALVIAALALAGGIALAWETDYDGTVLPDSPELGAARWTLNGDLSLTSITDSVLRTVDPWSDRRNVYFYRESGMPAGTPVTVEARLRVMSSAPLGRWFCGAGFGVQTWSDTSGGTARIDVFADRVVTRYLGDAVDRVYAADLTQWHTIRVAMSTGNWFDVWMDGTLLFSGAAWERGQDGVSFGTGGLGTVADVEWDYVRYSKEYLPVPEPGSLVVLAGGLSCLGASVLRRRR